MRKIINIIILTILAISAIFTFSVTSFAATLETIDVRTDKTTVRPGTNVKVNIEFGQELGSYTFSIAYDNRIFEYVDAEGGTARDTTEKVNVVYFDEEGGLTPRTNMSVTFKAKEDITTSNPTEFTITARGLANNDASVSYDDITTPIVKNVVVEPEYSDYKFKLEHTGNIIKGKEKEMTISYFSAMGRHYEHARLRVEATTPAGANVKLLATDQENLEHDLIQSGWGNAQGYPIGGEDYNQVLKVRGIFSEVGEYSITLKLINRDNSDEVIKSESFKVNVIESEPITPAETNQNNVGAVTTTNTTSNVIENKTTNTTPTNQAQEKAPTQLPKTGNNIYVAALVIMVLLICSYIYYNKSKNRN